MTLYFAYGANMDIAAMRKRCPRSKPLGTGRLMHHRFVIMPEGYASVLHDRDATVHGVVFDLATEDLPELDKYEGLSIGLYSRLIQTVFRDNGMAGPAFVYMGRGGEGGAPLPGYMETVAAAARAVLLPREYIMEIERHLPKKPAAPSTDSPLPPSSAMLS